MIWWDRKFLNILATVEILIILFLIYIADINLAVESLSLGTYYDAEHSILKMDQNQIEVDQTIPDDVRTMSVSYLC